MNEFDLNIGAQVFCSDGKCGSLAKIVVDPNRRQVTHLIVEEGFLLKRSRVFPFSSIEGATAAEIQLLLRSEELENYPVYREETIETPAPSEGGTGTGAVWREGAPYGAVPTVPAPVILEKVRQGVSDELAVLDRSTAVEGLDNGIGKLDHLLVDAHSGEITQIVVQQGLLFATRRAIPASAATLFAEEAIFVSATEEELKAVAEYHPGEHDAARATIDDVEENDNPAQAAANEHDVDLTTRVAMTLFEDPRTSNAVIEVIDEHGVVTLEGDVDSVETREAAEEIARSLSGVTTVNNLLRVEH